MSVLIIPPSVESLGESAFEGCSSLLATVTPATSMGAKCFNGCKEINMNTKLSYDDGDESEKPIQKKVAQTSASRRSSSVVNSKNQKRKKKYRKYLDSDQYYSNDDSY